jgi:hypothetical protein
MYQLLQELDALPLINSFFVYYVKLTRFTIDRSIPMSKRTTKSKKGESKAPPPPSSYRAPNIKDEVKSFIESMPKQPTVCNYDLDNIDGCDLGDQCQHQQLFLCDILPRHCANDAIRAKIAEMQKKNNIHIADSTNEKKRDKDNDPFHKWATTISGSSGGGLKYAFPGCVCIMESKHAKLPLAYIKLPRVPVRDARSKSGLPFVHGAVDSLVLIPSYAPTAMATGAIPYVSVVDARIKSASHRDVPDDIGINMSMIGDDTKIIQFTQGGAVVNPGTTTGTFGFVPQQPVDMCDKLTRMASLPLDKPWLSRLVRSDQTDILIESMIALFSVPNALELLAFQAPPSYGDTHRDNVDSDSDSDTDGDDDDTPATASDAYTSESKKYGRSKHTLLQIARYLVITYYGYFNDATDRYLNQSPTGLTAKSVLTKTFNATAPSSQVGVSSSSSSVLLGAWQVHGGGKSGGSLDMFVITIESLKALWSYIISDTKAYGSSLPFKKFGLQCRLLSNTAPDPQSRGPPPRPLQTQQTRQLYDNNDDDGSNVLIPGPTGGLIALSYVVEITLANWKKFNKPSSVVLYTKEPSTAPGLPAGVIGAKTRPMKTSTARL